jgi:hypothetical protein
MTLDDVAQFMKIHQSTVYPLLKDERIERSSWVLIGASTKSRSSMGQAAGDQALARRGLTVTARHRDVVNLLSGRYEVKYVLEATPATRATATFRPVQSPSHGIYVASTVHCFANPDAASFGAPGIAQNKLADERSWQALTSFFAETFAAKGGSQLTVLDASS